MPTLANLYDADRRRTDPVVGELAASELIPHPLRNVEYADGVFMPCTHAKTHARFERCPLSPNRSSEGVPPGSATAATVEVTVDCPAYRAVPASCRCGGSWAWVRVEGRKATMVGCVCHHTPADDRIHSE